MIHKNARIAIAQEELLTIAKRSSMRIDEGKSIPQKWLDRAEELRQHLKEWQAP